MSADKHPEHHKRDLLLSDRISQSTVKDIIKDIFEINFDDDEKEEIYKEWKRTPIRLFINSYGGSVYDGLALIDVIRRSKTPVHTVCIGSCMSMALWVWLSGAKRFVGESATLMFHDVSLFAYDKTEGIKQELNEMIRLQEMDLEFYDKELTDSKRTLIALSNFLKDEIDPALFARAYHQIITAGYAENSIPLDYLKSGMILAGLSKPEHIKIWLDDVREAPEGYCHCHSVNETIKKIIKCEKEYAVIDEINCDHDLGDYASDGGDGIKLIDWLVKRKTYYPVKLHTMNPVGRENMQREIDRYWNETK